ncbi:hypothetical protein V6Z11_D12G136400 [Gossypium hirsutum]
MIRTMGIHRQHLFDLKVLVLLKFSTVLYFVTAEVVARSKAWLGRGFSCVCAQSRESDARPSFDLTPSQLRFETEDKARRLLVMCHFC